MHRDFTINSYIKCWLKIWPVTLLLILSGIGVGCFLVSSVEPTYNASSKILMVNSDYNAEGTDYLALAKSDSMNDAVKNDNCNITPSQSGNTITFSIRCNTSEEETVAYTNHVVSQYESYLFSIYNKNDALKTEIVNKADEVTQSGGLKEKALKLASPIAVAVFCSLVIAFVLLDYKN